MKKIYLMFAFLLSVPAFAATRYLVQLGSNGAATWRATGTDEVLVDLTIATQNFQAWFAATSMVAGDEVWLAAGTYVTGAAVNLKDGVSIYGSFAGTETNVSGRALLSNKTWDFTNPTILDGNNGSFMGMNCTAAMVNSTVIDGITLTKFERSGTGNGAAASLWGTVTMRNCVISNNKLMPTAASQNSGALYLRTGVQVVNCWIHHNQASTDLATGTSFKASGGGISMAGQNLIKGCIIENNSAAANGGAVSMHSATASNSGGGTFEDCIIRLNVSAANGGAVYQSLTQPASTGVVTALFKNCQITDNTAATRSGGLDMNGRSGDPSHTLSIEGCIFARNTTTTGTGGALSVGANIGVFEYLKNCIFRDNSAPEGEGGAFSLNKPTTISNCVIVNNAGLSAGYANATGFNIYNCTFANNSGIGLKLATASVEAKNNIFWFNTDNTITGGTTPVLEYNAYNSGADPGTGSISTLSAANTFVAPTTFVGVASSEAQKSESEAADWTLKAGSPAIDAGIALASVTTDRAGKNRPQGAGYDMGAYEFSPGPGTSVLKDPAGKSQVYPTLTNGMLYIENVSSLQNIRLFDLTGKLVGEWAPVNRIDIEGNRSGIYILQLKNSDGNFTNYKILKQ
jgi:hypothetical protein